MIENTKHSVSSATYIYIHTKITATPIKDNKQKSNPAGIKTILYYRSSHSTPQYSMRRLNPRDRKESMADEKRTRTHTPITTNKSQTARI